MANPQYQAARAREHYEASVRDHYSDIRTCCEDLEASLTALLRDRWAARVQGPDSNMLEAMREDVRDWLRDLPT
jgi:hypothetical protein